MLGGGSIISFGVVLWGGGGGISSNFGVVQLCVGKFLINCSFGVAGGPKPLLGGWIFQHFCKCSRAYSCCQLLITVVGITCFCLFLSEFSAKNPRFNHCWVRR